MKTKVSIIFLLTILTLFVSKDSLACVDPDPTKVVVITVNYDTLEYQPFPFIFNVELRISNLRLMDETPNKFCTCAFWHFNPGQSSFDDITYVAFVDSGTNIPYNGFSLFDSLKAASNAWNNTSSDPWKGYVSDVINGGLQATSPVELVVRFKLNLDTIGFANYTLNGDSSSRSLKGEIDSTGGLGTDEWDPLSQTVVNAHRGDRGFAGKTSYHLKSVAYFDALDAVIMGNIPVDTGAGPTGLNDNGRVAVNRLMAYPSPFKASLSINIKIQTPTSVQIELFDITGRIVGGIQEKFYQIGDYTIDMENVSILKEGVYFIKYNIGTEQKVLKVIKS